MGRVETHSSGPRTMLLLFIPIQCGHTHYRRIQVPQTGQREGPEVDTRQQADTIASFLLGRVLGHPLRRQFLAGLAQFPTWRARALREWGDALASDTHFYLVDDIVLIRRTAVVFSSSGSLNTWRGDLRPLNPKPSKILSQTIRIIGAGACIARCSKKFTARF